MNWARGLTRLWLVLTILWVAFMGVIAWSAVVPYSYEKTRNRTQVALCELSAPPERCPERETIVEYRTLTTNGVLTFAAFLVLPPSAVFGFGAVLLWVLAGFSRHR